MLGASPRLHQHQDTCKVSEVFLSKMFLSKTWSDDPANCVFQNCLWWLRLRNCSLIIFFFLNVHNFWVAVCKLQSPFFFLICRCVLGVNSDLSNQPNLLLGQFWDCQSSYLWVIKIACPLSFSLSPWPKLKNNLQLVTPKLRFCGSFGNRTSSTGLYQYQLPPKSRRWNKKQLIPVSVHGCQPVLLACAASSIIDLVLIIFRCLSLSSSVVLYCVEKDIHKKGSIVPGRETSDFFLDYHW